jgi:hypothetical protein
MSPLSRNYLVFLLIVNIPTLSYSDSAPPSFPGYSLTLKDTGSVRLKSETVDITYNKKLETRSRDINELYSVEAVFEIVNTKKTAVERKIGFPFHVYTQSNWVQNKKDSTVKIYEFKMTLNGKPQTKLDAPGRDKFGADRQHGDSWACKFNPGVNIVKLTYNIFAVTFDRYDWWVKSLSYNLTADTTWQDTIDELNVTIHFPQPIAERQVVVRPVWGGTFPAGYDVKGNAIRWRFSPYTPRSVDFINLRIIDFAWYEKLLDFERVLTETNARTGVKLAAATFFAEITPHGFDSWAPPYVPRSYYDSIMLPHLTSSERRLFDETYTLQRIFGSTSIEYYSGDNLYNREASDSVRRTVSRVLERVGFYEKYSYPLTYKNFLGMQRLFKEVVAAEPKNAAAWRAYIDNYYKIESGAWSPCDYRVQTSAECPASQKELVKAAFRNCPNDPEIALWYESLFSENLPLPDTITFSQYAQAPAAILDGISQIDGSRKYTKDDIALLEKVYSTKAGEFHIRGPARVDDTTRKKIIEILGGRFLYRQKFCKELEKLRVREKGRE